jgi:hypothetical protein
MPRYLSDHEVYDALTHTDRKVELLIECPHTVIEHLPAEILAHAAIDMPEKGFTITVKLAGAEARQAQAQAQGMPRFTDTAMDPCEASAFSWGKPSPASS